MSFVFPWSIYFSCVKKADPYDNNVGQMVVIDLLVFIGLIQREVGSMEKELGELRRSRPKPSVGGDFTLSDCFYFSRKGIESIVEDEVHIFFFRCIQRNNTPDEWPFVS